MPELLDLARKLPERIHYGSTGEGGALHLAGELLNKLAGIQLKHVPYKGTVQGVNDVVGGQIEMTIPSMAAAVAQANAGKLRILAVTGTSRAKQAPNVAGTCMFS